MRVVAARALVVGVIAAVAGGGCLLTTSFDGLSDGKTSPPADSAAPDRSSSGGDGSSGGPDGSPSDAPAIDATSSDFCGGAGASHLFCADFDHVPLPAGFLVTQESGGTLGLDPAIFLSPSQSLRVTSVGKPTGVNVGLYRSFPQGTKTSRFAFSIRIESLPDTAPTLVLASIYFSSSNGARLHVATNNGVLNLVEGTDAGFQYTNAGAIPKVGAWTRMELAIDYVARTATLAVEGSGTFSRSYSFSPGAPEIGLGVTAGTPAADLRYDNVTFDQD